MTVTDPAGLDDLAPGDTAMLGAVLASVLRTVEEADRAAFREPDIYVTTGHLAHTLDSVLMAVGRPHTLPPANGAQPGADQ